MENLFEHITALQQKGEAFVLCTLVYTRGSVPRKAGSKMLVQAEGTIIGSVGGGVFEQQVKEDALEVLNIGHCLLKDYARDAEGSEEIIKVFLEPFAGRGRLHIFGAGHVGAALAQLAKQTGFNPWVADPREELKEELVKEGIQVSCGDYLQIAANRDYLPNDYVFVTTFSHETDMKLLGILAKQPLAWLGMIGSKRKAETARQFLHENQLASSDQIDRIEMPAGIPIKAETPREIAVSILARLIDLRNTNLSQHPIS